MTKIAVIRNCSQCPHSMMVTLGIGSDSRNGWICAHLGFPRKHRTDAESEVQWDTIDARCPLPDAPAWPVVQSDDEERDPGTALESAR